MTLEVFMATKETSTACVDRMSMNMQQMMAEILQRVQSCPTIPTIKVVNHVSGEPVTPTQDA